MVDEPEIRIRFQYKMSLKTRVAKRAAGCLMLRVDEHRHAEFGYTAASERSAQDLPFVPLPIRSISNMKASADCRSPPKALATVTPTCGFEYFSVTRRVNAQVHSRGPQQTCRNHG